MRSYRIVYIMLLFVTGCAESPHNDATPKKDENKSVNSTSIYKNERKLKSIKQAYSDVLDYYHEMLRPKTDTLGGYTFKYGYYQYDEDKFGFSNPGYLSIFKKGKLIYKDQFKGEGPLYLESLGYHNLAGRKLLFSFNHGTQACDYNSYDKFYAIEPNDKIRFIKEYYSSSGGDGYASFYHQEIFPKDTLGEENTLMVIEGLIFHEKDEPDRFDTTKIHFTKNGFKINKRIILETENKLLLKLT